MGGEFKHNAKCQCPTCLSINNAKLHIGDVRKFADQITQKGQLILSDISGPFPVSVDGYRYVISFTDSYSRFSCCYMLRNKSDSEAALEALVSFYARNGILIREIRSDQGGEFGGSNESPSVSGEGGSLRDKDSIDFFFKRVCEKHNIVHTLMPAYRPELHGLAERWNLTVMKMANAMLFSARLSHILWTSAVAHANMLRNRLPLRGLGPYTPYELFYNKRPRVDSLRVFGCDAYKLLPTYPKIPGQLARKRLIYCGETADRVGFRVFDPITYKFSTEFELIFDEHSARKRINSLWEYDARRDLKRHGKLQQLPLQTDDYAEHDTSQEAVRNVFSSASATPTILGIGAAVDDIDSRNGAAGDGSGSSPLDPAAHFKQRVERDPSTSSSRTVSQNEPGNDISISEPNHHGFLNLPSSTSEGAASSNQNPEILRHMNGRAVSQRPQSDCKRDTVPTILEEGDDDDEPEEFKVHGQSLRPGPLPSLRPRKQQVVADYELSDVDGASVLLNDPEADKLGPLTMDQLEAERKKSQPDMRHLRRPLRYLPAGQIEIDSPEFKTFRKYALDENILVSLVDNPKQVGSASWKRFSKYQLACTLREIIELSATSSDPVQ